MNVGNPYESVDWRESDHHRGQFHVHPNYGEKGSPADVIDAYHELGYTVLAVQSKSDLQTAAGDHAAAYPWDELAGTTIGPDTSDQNDPPDWTENRDPVELGMIAIESVELDEVEHMTHFFGSFNEVDAASQQTQFHRARESIETTDRGITGLAHPGRYNESDIRGDWADHEWERYDILYRNQPRFFGLEVLNGAFSADDRILWDDLLTQFTPSRSIFGTAVDDATTVDVDDDQVDSGRTVFVMSPGEFEPGHESGAIYDVWMRGQFYFSMVENGDEDHPTIKSIEHDEDDGELTVTPSDDVDHEKWIADGEVVHEGRTLDYQDHADEINGYVRFEGVRGDDASPPDDDHPPDAIVCTQPFVTTGTIARGELE